MTDDVATLAGYTKEIRACSQEHELYLLVKPEEDLDGAFKAWDTDMQEFITVNGWLFTIDMPESV